MTDPTTPDDVGAMADVLRDFGVDLFDPARRAEKAQELVKAGVDPEEALAVFSHLERSSATRDVVPGLVAKLALEPHRVKHAVEEVAAHERAREDRAMRNARNADTKKPKKGPRHYVGLPSPWHDCPCEGCAERKAAGHPIHGLPPTQGELP